MGTNGSLKDIVDKVLSSLKDREKEESDIFKAWKNAAGKKAAKHTELAFLKAKKLVVNVSDSSWLYKLTLEKDKIIKKFNKTIKTRKKIKELQFRIGKIKDEEGHG